MEFPFGHHHHRRGSNEENPNPNPYPPPAHIPYGYQPPPPPPQQYYDGPTEYAPPPPPVHHASYDYAGDSYGQPNVHHVAHEVGPGGYGPPPPVQHVAHEVGPGGYGPPPTVQHVGHEVEQGGYGYDNRVEDHHHHHHHLHRPGFFPSPTSHVEHVGHESRPSDQQTVRVFTKADEHYSLTIRDGEVVLAPANPQDDYQHWIKDLKYSTRVKDEEGLPSFSLVNKVTGQAIKHSVGATHPVRLVPYNPDYLDESVLWTESKDTGANFRCIRMVNNIRLNFDAFHGDEDHGGVRDGTKVVLWEWLKGKNQRWKIVPY